MFKENNLIVLDSLTFAYVINKAFSCKLAMNDESIILKKLMRTISAANLRIMLNKKIAIISTIYLLSFLKHFFTLLTEEKMYFNIISSLKDLIHTNSDTGVYNKKA